MKKKQKQKLVEESMLFDLIADLGESKNLMSENPKMVQKLNARMIELDQEITANARSPWVLE